jgi:hypothetical protein
VRNQTLRFEVWDNDDATRDITNRLMCSGELALAHALPPSAPHGDPVYSDVLNLHLTAPPSRFRTADEDTSAGYLELSVQYMPLRATREPPPDSAPASASSSSRRLSRSAPPSLSLPPAPRVVVGALLHVCVIKGEGERGACPLQCPSPVRSRVRGH